MSDALPVLVPAPDTHHLDFTSHQATFICGYMAEGRHAVKLIEESRDARTRDMGLTADLTFTQVHLTIRKAHGHAAYVGPPAIWVWKVAIDDRGRWISGPADRVEVDDIEALLWRANYGALWAVTLNDIEWRHHDAGKEPQP